MSFEIEYKSSYVSILHDFPLRSRYSLRRSWWY